MLASNSSSLSYRRLRAPKNHGETLHFPPATDWQDVWNQNLQVNFDNANFKTADLRWIREKARRQFVQAAIDFTKQYRDVDLRHQPLDRIVMSGHQPTLFHPGVWYKNFALDQLAKKLDATPINWIIDNDSCNTTFIQVPARDESSTYFFRRVHFDKNGPAEPFEFRKIADGETFKRFGDRLAEQVAPLVEEPIINRLWPYVLETNTNNLGLAISKGRHRLEQDYQLQTLELPLSFAARTHSFVAFAKEIMIRHQEMLHAYNAALQTYRRIHKIKNPAQPLPDLETQGEWTESPFWVWRNGVPIRRSLFVRSKGSLIEFSDLKSVEGSFPQNASIEELQQRLQNDVCIRPKALMTTLFLRLVACDLFIHGIGGSKYDQLTDALAKQLFNIILPKYLTITATYHLQPVNEQNQHPNVTDLQHQLRNLRYHPESFIETIDDDASKWIAQKRNWIHKQLPRGKRLTRHQAITESNLKLQIHVQQIERQLRTEIATANEFQKNAKVLQSREYSFAMFDGDLANDLAAAVKS